MYYKILYSVLCVLSTITFSFSQKINDSLQSKNGTYRGTYTYKNKGRAETEYIRIQFMDDSTFAYATCIEDNPIAKERQLNLFYNETPGIGRLTLLKGKKTWVGLQDMRLSNMDIAELLEAPSDQLSFSKALDRAYKNSQSAPSQLYSLTNFIFEKDSIHFVYLNDCCKAYREAMDYGKVDSKKLKSTVYNSNVKYDSVFTVSTKNNSVVKRSVVRHDYNNFSEKEYTIKSNCDLTEFPIPEKGNSNKITGYLKAGEKVRTRPLIYMNYIYVGQTNPQDKFIVTKSGWLPMEYLQK